MGEEEDRDPQRLKRIAAAAYDYDNDPRWAEYWSNVLIPPHMAARSDVVDHFKRKFYQRFIDPDLVVEAMSSTSSSQSSRASDGPSSQTTAQNLRPQNSGSGSGSTGRAPSTGRNVNSLRLDQRSIQFSVNAWVLVVATLGMLPVAPRNLSNKAYRLSLLGTACSSVCSLYTVYGKPRAWNLPAIQTWLQTIIGAKDFIHFIYCITLITSKLHLKFALIPVFCWAVDHVARFLRRNFARSTLYRKRTITSFVMQLWPRIKSMTKWIGMMAADTFLFSMVLVLTHAGRHGLLEMHRKYLEEPCIWVEANGTTLNILSSNAEIALGFLLIISLFSLQRNIIQTFIYWQLLKLMYHAPVTAGYHQSVWARIGRAVNPYIYRYTPFLNSPISAVQRWWFR